MKPAYDGFHDSGVTLYPRGGNIKGEIQDYNKPREVWGGSRNRQSGDEFALRYSENAKKLGKK